MTPLFISFQGKRYKCVSFDGLKMLCVDLDSGETRALEPGPHARAYEHNPWDQAAAEKAADQQSGKDAAAKLSEGLNLGETVAVEKNPKK